MIQLKVLVCASLASIAASGLMACDKNDTTTGESKANTVENKTEKKGDELGQKLDQMGDKVEQKTDQAKKDLEAKEPVGTGGGPAVSGTREWARDKMAKVRCDHYQTCGDVATGKKYDTMDSCVTRERASLDKDWELKDCAKIDEPRLDACITAVKAKKCDALFDTNPSECGESKVCIKP